MTWRLNPTAIAPLIAWIECGRKELAQSPPSTELTRQTPDPLSIRLTKIWRAVNGLYSETFNTEQQAQGHFLALQAEAHTVLFQFNLSDRTLFEHVPMPTAEELTPRELRGRQPKWVSRPSIACGNPPHNTLLVTQSGLSRKREVLSPIDEENRRPGQLPSESPSAQPKIRKSKPMDVGLPAAYGTDAPHQIKPLAMEGLLPPRPPSEIPAVSPRTQEPVPEDPPDSDRKAAYLLELFPMDTDDPV